MPDDFDSAAGSPASYTRLLRYMPRLDRVLMANLPVLCRSLWLSSQKPRSPLPALPPTQQVWHDATRTAPQRPLASPLLRYDELVYPLLVPVLSSANGPRMSEEGT